MLNRRIRQKITHYIKIIYLPQKYIKIGVFFLNTYPHIVENLNKLLITYLLYNKFV